MSGLRPYDLATWALEAAPVVLALPILWTTHRRFPLTSLIYLCIFLYGVVLMFGGAYAGAQFAEFLDLGRNPYDGIGHVLQGFVLALVVREILIRGQFVRGQGMRAFVVLCIVLALGAAYELVKWGAALALRQAVPADAQVNLFCAFAGALAALALFSRLHDRQLKRLDRVSRDLEVAPQYR